MDHVIARDFLTRWVASFGAFHAPLTFKDLVAVEWNALWYPASAWGRTYARAG
jgi:hypothetical protein